MRCNNGEGTSDSSSLAHGAMITGLPGSRASQGFSHSGRSIIYRAPFQTPVLTFKISASSADSKLKHKVFVFQKLALG